MKTPEDIRKLLEEATITIELTDPLADRTYRLNITEPVRKEVLDAFSTLESRLAQVERERDAMHRDMKLYSRCKACKRFVDGLYCPVHTECTYGGKGLFEWRGVCEENTKEEEK